MDLQFKAIPFDVKADSDGRWFEGKASPFWNIDSAQEIVDDKAFDEDLADFLADGFIGGINHSWDTPIGRPLDGTAPMADHLHIKASVVDTTHGEDVRKLLKAGVIKKLSIGYRVMGDMMLSDEEECMRYWESKGYTPNAQDMARCKHGARVLTRIKLYEVSPVTVPANDLAIITAVKAAHDAAQAVFKGATADPTSDEDNTPSTLREYEKFLRDAGLSVAKAKEAVSLAKTLLRDVESGDAGTQPEDAPAPDAPPVAAAEGEKGDAPPAPSTPLAPVALPFFRERETVSEDDVEGLGLLSQRIAARILEDGRAFVGAH